MNDYRNTVRPGDMMTESDWPLRLVRGVAQKTRTPGQMCFPVVIWSPKRNLDDSQALYDGVTQ